VSLTTISAIGVLLERSEELARIESALTEARSRRGTFVVAEGPAGIGKTALLNAARRGAAEGGMRVFHARGTELERDFAFGVVRQLFEPALAEASESERGDLLHGAAGVAAGLLGLPGAKPAEGLHVAGVDPSFAILHGLYWLCANLAAAGPLCVVVDDAHWVDAPSLRYLAFLLTRLEELSVALVVATRPREAGVDAALLASVTAAPSADVIRLHPLSRTAVAELVESVLGDAPDPQFVEACLHATGGTPFLLRELLGALREGGIAPTGEGAQHVERIGARSIGRTINLRLRRLPEDAGRLARALAVLEQSDPVHAARLAQLEEAEGANAAELLVRAGVLESGLPLTFVHPIVRRSIYEELSGADRAQAHRRAARVLAEQPGEGERVAQHLLVTEPAGDAWIQERLVQAASAARQQGALETEAAFLRRALVEPPPQDDQAALLLDLGMAEASAGLDGWAEHLKRAIDAAPNAVAAADAALVLAHALGRAQRFAESVEVLDRASSALEPDHSELALLLEAAAIVSAMNNPAIAPTLPRRRQVLRERAAADPAAPPEILAAAALSAVLTNEPAEVGADLATRALDSVDRTAAGAGGRPWFPFATWFTRAVDSLICAERYAQVLPLLDASIDQARKTGDSGRLAMGLSDRSSIALRRGDLSDAEEDARTTIASTALPAPPMSRVLTSALLVEALVERGELDAAEEVLAPIEPEARRETLSAATLRFARGRLRVEQGRITEAIDDFLAVGAYLTRAQISCPSYLPWRSEAALAYLALGDTAQARRLAEEELALARAFGTPRALGVAKRAAGLAAGVEQGELLLREAIEAFERGDARLERARTLADLGAMLRRSNRRTEARELLREALDGAHRAGAARLAQRAETELRATGARPRRVVLTGVDSLTASERRIAELASQNLTNREIAQMLFITNRTVEGHLTSVFRKLQLDSRNELPAALAEGTRVSA
jgi:DNA-binding CsgD family transcriptional regulator